MKAREEITSLNAYIYKYATSKEGLLNNRKSFNETTVKYHGVPYYIVETGDVTPEWLHMIAERKRMPINK